MMYLRCYKYVKLRNNDFAMIRNKSQWVVLIIGCMHSVIMCNNV